MKKIMFDNHYGLETAVLNGTKTMTRRIATKCNGEMKGIEKFISDVGNFETASKYVIQKFAMYKVGEVVAIAQSYKDAGYDEDTKIRCKGQWHTIGFTAGWENKMFVLADEMPHQIQITDVKLEHLQDITDEDCIKEGIVYDNPFPELADPNVYAFPVHGKKHSSTWRSPSPRIAFENLIRHMSGKKTWEDNPYVFVYSFKLIK